MRELLLILATLLFGVSLACPVGSNPFPAELRSVFDGDTFRADVRLLDNIGLFAERLRLDGIDAPERYGPGGVEARDALREMLPQTFIVCLSGKRDKYGRFSTVVLVGERNINAEMVFKGYAVWRYY